MEFAYLFVAALAGAVVGLIANLPTILRLVWPSRFATGPITKADVTREVLVQKFRPKTYEQCARCRTRDAEVFDPKEEHCTPCRELYRNHEYQIANGYKHLSLVPLEYMYDIGETVVLVAGGGFMRHHEGMRYGDKGRVASFCINGASNSRGKYIVNYLFMVEWETPNGKVQIQTARDEIAPCYEGTHTYYGHDRREIEREQLVIR